MPIQTINTFKINLATATSEQKFQFLNLVGQEIQNSKIKGQSRNKKEYPLKVFRLMLDYHSPRNEEMSVSNANNRHFRDWAPHHLTSNANHLEKTFGFDPNELPHHQVWDEIRQKWRQTYLNYCGAEMDPMTDDNLIEMLYLYGNFPRRYTESAMGIIGELINSHLTDPVIFDN